MARKNIVSGAIKVDNTIGKGTQALMNKIENNNTKGDVNMNNKNEVLESVNEIVPVVEDVFGEEEYVPSEEELRALDKINEMAEDMGDSLQDVDDLRNAMVENTLREVEVASAKEVVEVPVVKYTEEELLDMRLAEIKKEVLHLSVGIKNAYKAGALSWQKKVAENPNLPKYNQTNIISNIFTTYRLITDLEMSPTQKSWVKALNPDQVSYIYKTLEHRNNEKKAQERARISEQRRLEREQAQNNKQSTATA